MSALALAAGDADRVTILLAARRVVWNRWCWRARNFGHFAEAALLERRSLDDWARMRRILGKRHPFDVLGDPGAVYPRDVPGWHRTLDATAMKEAVNALRWLVPLTFASRQREIEEMRASAGIGAGER